MIKIDRNDLITIKQALFEQKQMWELFRPRRGEESAYWLAGEALSNKSYNQAMSILMRILKEN